MSGKVPRERSGLDSQSMPSALKSQLMPAQSDTKRGTYRKFLVDRDGRSPDLLVAFYHIRPILMSNFQYSDTETAERCLLPDRDQTHSLRSTLSSPPIQYSCQFKVP